MTQAPVTLLFTDLVNSTELLQRAGDELAQRIFQAHHRLLKHCVAAHGGQEVKWLGDGLMTVFASPADAVRCAVAMQQTARRRAAGARLAIRVGLNVGEVLREESDYFGTPVIVARRLCDQAQGGQILCSSLVSGLLAGQQVFTFRDHGLLALKGLSAPVAASEVLYQQDQPTALLTHTPFVGRVNELARLTAKLRDARAGSGGLVMLVGEPGIGKTRALEECAETARTEGALVLWGRCYEGEAARPYGPFVEALTDYARSTAPESLRADLGIGAAPLARLVPGLRERLPDVPEPVVLQPDEERLRLLDAMAQFLIVLSARRPVVLVLDDLHWADAASVVMLRHVARFATRHCLLLLGAYREIDVTPQQPLADALGALPRETTYEHLPLAGLDIKDVEQLLEAVADQKVPDALVTMISSETSGNPFFIREVLLHLVEEGKIFWRDGQWTANVTIEQMGIPQGVRQVIRRRLARLSDAAIRLLRAAAGFSGRFPFDVAARVADLAEDQALDAIDEALGAQLLCPASEAETFDFTHALVRHTLYAELSPPRQVRLHRRIAESMEEIFGDLCAPSRQSRAGEYSAEIAQHYYRSATLPGAERGVAYALVAADGAERSTALAEGVAYLRLALALLPQTDERRARLEGRLAIALAWNLSLDEAVHTATHAGDMIAASEGNDAAADFLADAADAVWLAAQTPRAWSVAVQGLRFLGKGRRDATWARLMVFDIERREATDPAYPGIPVDSLERREVTARLWELPAFSHTAQKMFGFMAFRSREDVLTRAGNDPVALLFWAGEYRRALPMLEEGVATALDRGQVAVATLYLSFIARIQLTLGDLPSFLPTYVRTTELYERIKEIPWLRTLVSTALIGRIIVTGEGWELMLAGMETALREGAAENQWAAAVMRSGTAYAAAYLGRREDAFNRVASVIPAIERAPGSTVNYPVLISMAALALEAIERRDHAETIERNLRAKWLQPDFRYPLSDARQSLALLCSVQGRFEEASEWFAKSREVLEAQGAVTTRARTDLYEARMFLRRDAAGDRQRAAMLLDAALEQFHTIGMTGWARLAEELRAQCAAEARGMSSEPDSTACHTVLTEPSTRGTAADGATSALAVLRHEGDYWSVAYGGRTARVRDLKGLHYLAHLLRHPGQEFHVLELVQGAGVRGHGSDMEDDGSQMRSQGLEMLDASAKTAYRRRIVELRDELQEAEQFNDTERVARAREDLETISDQLASAVGLGGRDRRAASASERARSAVAKRINDALKKVADASPTLGDHLRRRVKSGAFCVYLPDAARPIEWKLD